MPSITRRVYKALKRGARVLRPIVPRALQSHPWQTTDDGSFQRRSYRSYDQYVAHQARKLGRLKRESLEAYGRRYRALLRERLARQQHVRSPATVLCLGARLGTEVLAFHDLGCFGVGIDLNPGAASRLVLSGDFHDVQFPSGSVDVVFSNSLDHALHPERLFAEMRRLLRRDGLLVLELQPGAAEGGRPMFYEALSWRTAADVIARVEAQGFRLLSALPFTEPWHGTHVTLAAE